MQTVAHFLSAWGTRIMSSGCLRELQLYKKDWFWGSLRDGSGCGKLFATKTPGLGSVLPARCPAAGTRTMGFGLLREH